MKFESKIPNQRKTT